MTYFVFGVTKPHTEALGGKDDLFPHVLRMRLDFSLYSVVGIGTQHRILDPCLGVILFIFNSSVRVVLFISNACFLQRHYMHINLHLKIQGVQAL